jgi:hypothetical protein
MQQISEGASLSKRWTRQCIKNLERWGLLRVDQISGQASHYCPLPISGEEVGGSGVHSSLMSFPKTDLRARGPTVFEEMMDNLLT